MKSFTRLNFCHKKTPSIEEYTGGGIVNSV